MIRRHSAQTRGRFWVEALEHRWLLAAGDPDTTFSNDGVTTVDFPGSPIAIKDVALQSDGKVVLVGHKSGNMAVARLNVDGSLDTTFGNGGLFESTFRPEATTVAIQPDNKILLGFGEVFSFANMAVVRLHANGSGFDSSFGENGVAALPGEWSVTSVNAIAVQHDGKIIAAGGRDSGGWDFTVARYTAAGVPDPTFDQDGVVVAAFGEDDEARAVAIDYHGTPTTNPYYGTIVAVGDKRPGEDDPPTRFAIARLNPDGSFDNSFDGDGRLTSPDLTPLPGESATGVQIQAAGKIVVSGTALTIQNNVPQSGNVLLARYLSTGAIDTSYGPFGSGIVHDEFGGDERMVDAAPNSVGGLLVSGSRNGTAAIVAYTRDGHPELRFSGDSLLTTSFGGAAHVATTLDSITPTRRVILAGNRAVGRYLDIETGVTLGAGVTDTSEATQGTINVFVSRTEPAASPLRVYVNIGGTARAPILGLPSTWDYGTSGITLSGFDNPRNYVDIPAGQAFTTFSITPFNDTRAEGDEFIELSVAADPTYDIGTPSSTVLAIRDDDVVGGPSVNSSQFLFETGPQRAQFKFNQNVAGISADDFEVTGPPGTPTFAFDYNSSTNTATLSFNGILPDGDFTVRAIAAGIRNSSNQPMAADHVLDFWFLQGDATRDRKVNIADFLRIDRGFARGRTEFSNGDFDYSGVIDGTDFFIIDQAFLKFIGVAAAHSATESATGSDESDATGLVTMPLFRQEPTRPTPHEMDADDVLSWALDVLG